MSLVLWIAFGLIIGIFANIIDPFPGRRGYLGSMILGILGAVLGGLTGNIVFGISISGFNFPSASIAVLGSLLLLFLSRIASPKY